MWISLETCLDGSTSLMLFVFLFYAKLKTSPVFIITTHTHVLFLSGRFKGPKIYHVYMNVYDQRTNKYLIHIQCKPHGHRRSTEIKNTFDFLFPLARFLFIWNSINFIRLSPLNLFQVIIISICMRSMLCIPVQAYAWTHTHARKYIWMIQLSYRHHRH